MDRRNIPYEYIVFEDRPPFVYGGGCRVRTIRIPRGKTFNDVRDRLPASMGRMAVVRAYSAGTAREYAATRRGVRC